MIIFYIPLFSLILTPMKAAEREKIDAPAPALSHFHGTKPRQVSPGVFEGEFTTDTGKKLHIRMQHITPELEKNLTVFEKRTGWLTRRGIGILYLFLQPQEENNYQIEKYGDDLSKISGYSGQALVDLKAKLAALSQNPKKLKMLECTYAGASQLLNGEKIEGCKGKNYFVYITADPTFSFSNTPSETPTDGTDTIKAYFENYGRIIMCLSTCMAGVRPLGKNNKKHDIGPNTYENRGIFRNPVSIINGGDSGLATAMHGFIGAVVQVEFPSKTVMTVSPIGSMQKILKDSLKPGQGYLYDKDGNKIDVTELAEISIIDQGNYNHIKVEAITPFYYGTQQ
ncbi:MAG: hypothetical protein FJX71_02220 [Alphaproteobacteria bacterium]|nr:hypothetical protein [Alphaproteobacteria bacterium]